MLHRTANHRRSRRSASSPLRLSTSRRPRFESLEDRRLLAQLFTVENATFDSNLAELNPATGQVTSTFPTQSGVLMSGLAYDSSTSSLFGFDAFNGLYRINTTTGGFTPIGSSSAGINGLAVQRGTFDLFGITGGGALYRVNKTTGATTFVGSSGAAVSTVHGLAFSPGGTLYASDTVGTGTSNLLTINPATGARSMAATINRDFVVGLDFSSAGVLYGSDNGTDTVITINTSTGAATTVGPFGNSKGHNTIAWVGVGAGDTTPPNVTGRVPAPAATINTSSVQIDVTFSEPVQGLDASDLVLTGSAAAAASVGAISNPSGNTWRFPVSGLAEGTLNISLAPDPNDIEDAAGNDLAHLTWSYTVDLPGPNAPVLNAEPAVTPGTSNSISWSMVAGADEYLAEADDDPSFASPNANSGWISGTSHTFTGLAPGQTYHYRVRGRQNVAGTTGSWTQTSQADFSGDALSGASVTTSPGDVVLSGGSGGIVAGVISNPGFESGTTFSAPPWSLSSSGAFSGTNVTRSGLYFVTEGSNGLRFHTNTTGSYSPGQFIRLSQSVNLTGVDSIVFDVWNRDSSLVYADVLIDGVIQFTRSTSGSQNNASIDVSGLTGTHTLSIQERVRASHSGPSAWVAFDNFRAMGASGFVSSGSVTTPVIQPSPLEQWGELTFGRTVPGGTSLTVDILNSTGGVLASNVPPGVDLPSLGIGNVGIRLRANLSTSNPSLTPALHHWSLGWQATPDSHLLGPYSNVVSSTQAGLLINEVDSDTPGSDTAEFIELYDSGAGNTPLDGYVLVLYDGADQRSYAAIDLDGHATDANGFFVAGNPGVWPVDLAISPDLLRDGTAAVALYSGNAADFPAGTLVHAVNLLDAVVYDTGDADNAVLLATLTPGQPQVDEAAGGDSALHAIARIPDGGQPRETTTYLSQTPTPGRSNLATPGTHVTLSGNDLLIVDVADKSDRLSLALSGGEIVVRDPQNPFLGGVGELRVPAGLVTGSVLVQSRGGDDTLIVDLTGGNFTIPIVYDGGAQTSGDLLRVVGAGQDAVYSPDAAVSGSGTVATAGGGLIQFAGLEPVDMSGLGTVTLLLPGNDDIVAVNQGFDATTGTQPALVLSGTSGGVAFEALHAWNNGTLVVDTTAIDGDDSVLLAGAANAHGNTNLIVRTGAGNDLLTVSAAVTFAGDVSLASPDILLNGTLSAGAAATISLNAGAGAIRTGGPGLDLVAGSGVLLAGSGIGHDHPLESSFGTLAARNDNAGRLQIDNSAAATTLVIDTVSGTSGVVNLAAGDLRLVARDLDVRSVIQAAAGDVELHSSHPLRTIGLGSGGQVKGSGFDGASATFGLTDVELDRVLAGGQRRVVGGPGPDQFNLHYTGSDTQPLYVLGLDGEDRFFVAPSGSLPLHVDGGQPATGAVPGDTLALDMSSAVAPVVVDTLAGLALAENTAAVQFANIETYHVCDVSGPIDGLGEGDLYVRTTNDRERITLTLWNDGGLKLRVDNMDQGTSRTFAEHFGLVAGSQQLRQIIVYAQDGDDTLSVASHVVDAGGNPIPVEFHGEGGDDYLAGAAADDVLVGGPGNDRLVGGAGSNMLYGDGHLLDGDGMPIEHPASDGDDYLLGGAGDELLLGGGGNDRLYAGGGHDYAHGGSGNDIIDGGDGDDVLVGGAGNDSISGGYGNDLLLGGAGQDDLNGRQGDDVLLGGADADRLRGDSGNDLLVGGTSSAVHSTTHDLALRSILNEWAANSLAVPGGLGTLQLDLDEDWLAGDLGADRFHDGGEDHVHDLRATDGDELL
ncbi:MAG: Ig-like domain-containing protein [Pirellulaceae bacterium]|nr:Ig-like domain-containing protein [Pirellulaceae bacterium]